MDSVEKKIIEIIDQHQKEIIEIGRDIFSHAELGYKEHRTSGLFCRHMEQLGVRLEKDLAITGVKGYLKEKEEKEITVAVVGELDALPIKDSPYTNPETGAAHCCGHNAQMAAVMGAAYALCDPEIKNALEGNVIFFAVPAEEFVELEYKNELIKEGKIGYGGGKSELIRIGAFDDVDIVVGHHVTADSDLQVMNHPSTGFFNKMVTYHGKAAHAAGAPHDGVDALSAAMLAMQAIQMQQETYRDQDTVRVHGFISKGGEAMNVIADRITMEYSVRANNIPAMENANEKFDRSVHAGAVATGCGVEIITMPGYLPLLPVPDASVLEDVVKEFQSQHQYQMKTMDASYCMGGSTDFGDVSEIKPLLQFYTGGYSGLLHEKELHPVDEEKAYVLPAKIFALTVYRLLKNQAGAAKKLLESYQPVLTKEEYLAYMDSHNHTQKIPMTPLKHRV